MILKGLFMLSLIFNLHSFSFSSDNENKNTVKLEEKNYNNEIKLYIDNIYIPVIWENNKTLKDIKKQLKSSDIIVNLHMYSNNEQVGSLKKNFFSEDVYMTTTCGDIVLYNQNNIVLFYGSNTWSYTKLGKINLSKKNIEKILGTKNVSIKLSFK